MIVQRKRVEEIGTQAQMVPFKNMVWSKSVKKWKVDCKVIKEKDGCKFKANEKIFWKKPYNNGHKQTQISTYIHIRGPKIVKKTY